mgnify:CR=1 FL=1
MSYTNILYLYMSGILDRMRMVVTPIPPKEFRVKLNKIPTIKMAPVQMTDRTAFMDKIGKPRVNKRIVETRIPHVIEGEPAEAGPEEPGPAEGEPAEGEPAEPAEGEPAEAEPVEKIKIKTKRAYVKKKEMAVPIVADGEEKAPEKIKIKTKRAYVKKKEVDEPIVADEGDKSPERIKIKVKRLKKPIAKKMSSQLIIGVDSISERIGPLSDELRVETSNYYLNNREIFNNFMMSLYEPYKEELIEDARIGQSCDRSDDGLFTISTHQKIVRDYLNIHAPYRGILLYHGLGSGKTCSSISIAEGLKSNKRVIVMTPASLQKNYYEELKKCGDILYRKNQYWEFITTNDDNTDTLAKTLSIDPDFIRARGGVWLVDRRKKSNYDTLTTGDKKMLDLQIDEMIRTKYQFINYNGLTTTRYDMLSNGGTINPFDNAVIIVDESHNLISRIVNKIGTKKPSISLRIYQDLMKAQNSKVVLLSGTPILNYPNELGIMYNMIRGYIKTWEFKVDVSKTGVKVINLDFFKKLLNSKTKGGNVIDYIKYDANLSLLTITRNPFGFTNVTQQGSYKGVTDKTGAGNMNDDDFEKNIIRLLGTEKIKVAKPQIILNKSLPDTLKEFNKLFIKQHTGEFTNQSMFTRRILGLTSYFRSASESLLPRYMKSVNYHVIRTEMSDHQFKIYEGARHIERKLDKNNSKRKMKAKPTDIYTEAVSTYRIYSRSFCNFAFPEPHIMRPRPIEKEPDVEGEEINQSARDMIHIENIVGMTDEDNIGDSDDIEMISTDETLNNIRSEYSVRIDAALSELDARRDEFLTLDALATYSPKMLRILETIQREDMVGLHLLYSQFRTIEGIGIFKMILDTNGFTQFKIKRSGKGWELDIPEDEMHKPKYALYTGVEDPEEKEIIRNVFNGTWKYIPSAITEELTKINDNNLYGEIIKLLMITASGAEGINLFNVRHVHVMEPYWHHARIDQIIGRARRICSHKDLPDEHRTVDAYIYLMTLSEDQVRSDDSLELRMRDVSRINSSVPITTDESIFELAVMKNDISTRLLTAVKQSAIDCDIHTISGGGDEGLKCFSFGNISVDTYGHVPDISNEEMDSVTESYVKKTEIEAVELTDPSNGKVYALDTKTKKIYDYDSFKAKRPVQIGILVENVVEGKTQLKIELLRDI